VRKVVSFHSSRGGTGKTIIGANLAVLLANEGANVALIDLDFRAPSLFHIFKEINEEPVDYWVNDYLDSQCKPDDFLMNLEIPTLKGNLFVGFANPSIQAIQDMIGKSRSWEAKALQKLFELRRSLFVRGVNLCIYDTSPGIQYSSLNALISSDQIVFVSTSDPLEIEQVTNILREYNDIFENKACILLNKVFPETDYWSNVKQKEYINQLSEDFRNSVIGMIPCYCDLLKTKNRLLILDEPNHPLLKNLEETIQEIVYERVRLVGT